MFMAAIYSLKNDQKSKNKIFIFGVALHAVHVYNNKTNINFFYQWFAMVFNTLYAVLLEREYYILEPHYNTDLGIHKKSVL